MRGPGGGERIGEGMPGSPGIKVAMAVDVQVEAEEDSGKTQAQPAKIRSLFPETWLWDIVNVGLVFVLWEFLP